MLSFAPESALRFACSNQGTTSNTPHMSLIIKEEKFCKRTVYYACDVDYEERVLSQERYDCRVFSYKYRGRDYIFVGDRHNQVRQDVFIYVNHTRRGKPKITRMQMAVALQLYCTFCDMHGYDPMNLPADGYMAFKEFLRGNTVEAMPGSEVTYRMPATLRAYIGMIRAFLQKTGGSLMGFGISGDDPDLRHRSLDGGRRRTAIDTDLAGDTASKLYAPTHLRPDQVDRLANMMREAGDEATYLAFHIGIKTGFRRGGIVGLTIRDVVAEQVRDKDGGNGTKVQYWLYLRNRTTDGDDQHKKTLRPPQNEAQEQSPTFTRSFFKAPIDRALYNHIVWYFQWSRDERRVGGRDALRRIQEVTHASGGITDGENYYILYTNYNGRINRMTGQTLNNHLKKYFAAARLELNNVAHVMRHTFAMHRVLYSKDKCGLKELQASLGHASPQSTMRYFNIPEEEFQRLSKLFAADFNKLVPSFKMFDK